MKRYLPYYILGAAILAVGVVSFGLPVSSLWFLGFIVLCPLMMFMMMGNMHGGGGHGGAGGHGGTGGHGATERPEARDIRNGTGDSDRGSWPDH